MRTNILKADFANWLNHLATRWPHALRRLIHILSRRLAGHPQPLLPPPFPPQEVELFHPLVLRSADLFVPNPDSGVCLVRFVKLEREMADAEILRDLAGRGCRPASPKQVETTLEYRREDCPDGRLVALDPNRETQVFWKKGQLVNHFPGWFSSKHFAGDFVAAVVG